MIELNRSIFFAKPEEIDPENYVIATYYAESKLPLPEAGKQITIEESIVTWTEVTPTTAWIREKLPAKVFTRGGVVHCRVKPYDGWLSL